MAETYAPVNEEPFLSRGKMRTWDWAMMVWREWCKRGKPTLLGIPAEQLHEARRILGRQYRS